MSRRAFVAWLTLLGVLVAGTVTWLFVRAADGAHLRGEWILDSVDTASVHQRLHGPADFRPELWLDPAEAAVDPGCGSIFFDLDGVFARPRFTYREQERIYGPCRSRDPTPGRWTSWLGRVDQASRSGSLLVLTGPGVRLVWHPAPPPPPPEADAVPLDGAWLLESMAFGGRHVALDSRRPAVLGVDSFGGTLDTGCTRRYADWDVSSYHRRIRIVVAPPVHHACRSDLLSQERAFLHGLGGARQFTATARTLVLTGRSTILRFHRLPRLQIEQLSGTRWRLAGLVEGSVTMPARRFRAAPTRPQVRFSVIDGVSNLNRGCRGTAGGFGIDGTNRLMPLRPRKPCPFSTRLDHYLTAVYSHPWWFRIDDNTLYVQGYSGRGLVYQRLLPERSHPSG